VISQDLSSTTEKSDGDPADLEILMLPNGDGRDQEGESIRG
jgi:hypothetical protein